MINVCFLLINCLNALKIERMDTKEVGSET